MLPPIWAAPPADICFEGGPRIPDNDDCPEPLATGDDYHPWDDLNPLGFGARFSYAAPLLAGLGLYLRYSPSRPIAFDLGADYLAGWDAYGQGRQEIPIAADALLFIARGSFAHGYLLGGVGGSLARVESDERDARFGYLGVRLGGGVQLKTARELGLGLDGFAFARERVSGDASTEILTGSGSTATTSVGVVLRGSMTIYLRDW
jgi:hypothetical protein